MATLRSWMTHTGTLLALAGLTLTPAVAEGSFTDDFGIEKCTFAADGRQNPYFSLTPGDQLTLEGDDDGETVKVEITVRPRVKRITFRVPGGRTMSVLARVVEEREWVDDELVEVSQNWFARCRETNDVFYFGEKVDNYDDGEIVNHNGSWEAGKNGAQPGILLPARFLLGSRYFQEQAPGAMDRAEHVAMGVSFNFRGEVHDDCVEVLETSPLEPGSESTKVYCPEIGLVKDDEIELTSRWRP